MTSRSATSGCLIVIGWLLLAGGGPASHAQPAAEEQPPSPKKDLRDAENEKLRKRLGAEKPVVPSEWAVQGKVVGKQAQLEINFVLFTEFPGARVFLGCGKGSKITSASLDGETPHLVPADNGARRDGVYVVIDEPIGVDRHLTLQVQTEITSEQETDDEVLTLDLPRTAITRMDVELPLGARDVRLGDVPIAQKGLDQKGRRVSGSLEPSDTGLKLKWRQAGAVNQPALLTSSARVEVRLDSNRQLTQRAELQLETRGGPAALWQILGPAGVKVELAPEDDALLGEVVVVQNLPIPKMGSPPAPPVASLVTLRFKEPRTKVSVTLSTAPQSVEGSTRSVGPFALIDAVRQSGTILLVNQTPALHVHTLLRGHTLPREITAEEAKLTGVVHGFKFDRLVVPEKPLEKLDAASLSILDLDVEPVRGLLETTLQHTLKFVPESLVFVPGEQEGTSPPTYRWEVATTIHARMVQPGVETLEVRMPDGCTFIPLPADTRWPRPIRDAVFDPKLGIVTFTLAREDWKEFTVTLKGRYLSQEAEGETTLGFPQPVQTAMGKEPIGLEILALRHMELVVSVVDGLPLQPSGEPHRRTDVLNSSDQKLHIVWRKRRTTLKVVSTIDVTLKDREVHLRQQMRLHFAEKAPAQVVLTVPAGLEAHLTILSGGLPLAGGEKGTALIEFNDGGDKLVPATPVNGASVQSPAADPRSEYGGARERVLELAYSYRLHEQNGGAVAYTIPLVGVRDATSAETSARVWCETGVIPRAGERWSEQDLVVTDRQRLPELVISNHDLKPALTLHLEQETSAPSVVIERGLIRVHINSAEGHQYHAGFVIRDLTTGDLEVELPIPVRVARMQAVLEGKIVPFIPVDEEGRASESGRVARLKLSPSLVSSAALLEIVYFIRFERTEWGALWTTLTPPLVREASQPLVRWQVTLPPDRLPLTPQQGMGVGRIWVRDGWLFEARPALTSAELDDWLHGSELGERPSTNPVVRPSLVFWQGEQNRHLIVHVPRRPWMLLCSLVVVVFGMGLVIRWRRVLEGSGSPMILSIFLLILFAGLVVGVVVWPTTLGSVLTGCQPGLMVLLVAILVQWLLHERKRRRTVFLPSFQRGSTLSYHPQPTQGPGAVEQGNGSAPDNGASRPRSTPAHRLPPPLEPPPLDPAVLVGSPERTSRSSQKRGSQT